MWSFELGSNWKPFDSVQNANIEAAHSRKERAVTIRAAGNDYTVDLEAMTQINKATGTTRNVRRVIKQSAPDSSPIAAAKKPRVAPADPAAPAKDPRICIYFAKGRCRDGDKCRFTHAAVAPLPKQAAPAVAPPLAAASAPPAAAASAAAAPATAAPAAAPVPLLPPPPPGQPLGSLVVCVSGQMSMVRKQFWEWLRSHGARVCQQGVTKDTTHLITTAAEADNPTNKVLEAMRKGTLVVNEAFVIDAVKAGAPPADVTPYLLIDPATVAAPPPKASKQKAAPGTVAPGAAMQATLLQAKGHGPLVTVAVDAASAKAASEVMLADKYDEKKLDPTGWLLSEKLDGVRAFWDGANFYSRNGNAFPAPAWFKQGLPSTPLDGELWAGRRQFRRCLSIVRSGTSGDLWQFVTYLVFDAPALVKPYEERLAFINSIIQTVPAPTAAAVGGGSSVGGDGGGGAGPSSSPSTAAPNTPYAAPVGSIMCTGRAHVKEELAKVEAQGGEGLMLRKPGSLYEAGARSKSLLKVKSQKDEEAKVVAHEGGTGKNSFRTGALTLETPDGRQFSCGSGLSDHDRLHPPPLGSVVTYRFTELMENGYPRFPVFVGPRTDLDWATICASYQKADQASHQPGGLKRQHSIMYASSPAFPPAIAKQLSDRAEKAAASLPAADAQSDDEEDEDDGRVTDQETDVDE